MPLGILATFAAYILWGLFPFYFHALQDISALEILAHRVVWSLIFIAAVILAMRRTSWIGPALKSPATLGIFCLSAVIIGTNWGTYVYSIVSGRTIEASLGYFINPLVSIALGSIFLRERLTPLQKAAVGLAAAGVIWITWTTGAAPWLGLALAFTFGLYGLIRKMAPLGSIEGMALESLLLTPAAVLWLLHLHAEGTMAFESASFSVQALLAAAGPITAVPLLLFTAGVRRIPYSTAALIQYVSPTLVFFIGVFAFGEPFSADMLIGFLFIWTAVAVFMGDLFRMLRRTKAKARERAEEV